MPLKIFESTDYRVAVKSRFLKWVLQDSKLKASRILMKLTGINYRYQL